MKPPSIKKFDYLFLGSLAVNLFIFILTYDDILAMAQKKISEYGATALTAGVIFSLIVNLALWFLLSRQRIEAIKWVLAAFAAYTVGSILANLASGEYLGSQLLGLIPSVMSIAAIYFLFQPDAKAWFAERRRPD